MTLKSHIIRDILVCTVILRVKISKI